MSRYCNRRARLCTTDTESNLFSTEIGEKRRGSGLPTNRGIYKKIICNPTHHKMLLLSQKDNINRSRSRKLSWQFSLFDLLTILSFANPKVRRATSLLAQDDTLKGLLREPRTNGRTQFAPTDEIKIFCFIAYGSSFLTDTTFDRGRLSLQSEKGKRRR